MKKVDTNKVWRGKHKPEKLDMKGFSIPLSIVTANKEDVGDRKEHHKSENSTGEPSNLDTTNPSNRDTTVSRYHDTIIELIRKAVRELGKEAATHRFTMEEKRALADIIYTFKSKGVKTSENEITRIAVNLIINDYKANGEDSLLDKVLKALNE